jgi:KUP system potassium uptake protein
MITATFSLIHQLIGMKCFPSIRIHFTSLITPGQVYIPAVNYLLLIGTVATVGAFGSSFALTLAYGFAVATVMICTTTLIAIQIPVVKQLPWILGIGFFLVFGFLDGMFDQGGTARGPWVMLKRGRLSADSPPTRAHLFLRTRPLLGW